MRWRLCFSGRAFPVDQCPGRTVSLRWLGLGGPVLELGSEFVQLSFGHCRRLYGDGFYFVRFLQGFFYIGLESHCERAMSDCQCNGYFDMAAFYRHVSDHVEIDYADPYLGVKYSAETIDN